MAVHMREFPYTFEVRDFADDGDGRTVYGRIVPYGETTQFVDIYDGARIKQERFEYGALEPQTHGQAWSRVALSFQHDDGFPNTIGYGRQLQELKDGAYATFRLYKPDAEKAAEMIRESHQGLSVEFEPKRDSYDNGVVVRQRVHIRRVGITPDPAYLGAEVLAVRERQAELVIATPNLDYAREALAKLRRTL